MKNLESWQVRVIEEKKELDEKIHKLRLFLSENKDSDSVQAPLMREQFGVMKEYSAILGSRVSLFDGSES